MSAPKVFISYSHDSQDHKQWVNKLASDLRKNGIDALLDQWELAPGQDMAAFMQKGISSADRVLMICSEAYVKKAEEGVGGVGYERLVVTVEMVESIETKKFVPIIPSKYTGRKVPNFLGPRLYLDFSDGDSYGTKLEELLRELWGEPAEVKPSLGPNPFSSKLPSIEVRRNAGSTGRTSSGQSLLSDSWFEGERSRANTGFNALNFGQMELRFGLHDGIAKSQLELLTAARNSEIRTFGWPIGVLLENRDEYRPRPFADGIRAEIAVKRGTLSGGDSFDYWAVRTSGDYYLVQSLFEDQRKEREVFFNTRIVRVAESLLFASNFYTNLGVPPDAKLSVRIAHRGLANRTLTSSSHRRMLLLPKMAQENESETEIVVVIGEMRKTLVDDVRKITEPLFMLFDFQTFDHSVYEDIVRRFERGDVS